MTYRTAYPRVHRKIHFLVATVNHESDFRPKQVCSLRGSCDVFSPYLAFSGVECVYIFS